MAHELGMTVRDLQERLGSGYELTEWIAYLKIMDDEHEKAAKKASRR